MKRTTNASLGETLRPEDCFTLEIPQINSDKATKDRVFLSLVENGGYSRPGSVSSVSTITENSGSTKTLRSRSANEYVQREKLNKKTATSKSNKKTANSIAETISCGAFSSDGEQPANGKSDGSFMCAMESFLPSCCGASQQTEETATTYFVLPDDRSDIALVDRLDEDTLGSVDLRDRYATSSQQATRQRKPGGVKEKQSSRRLFGFRLRRSRTAERERAEKIFLPEQERYEPIKASRGRSRSRSRLHW